MHLVDRAGNLARSLREAWEDDGGLRLTTEADDGAAGESAGVAVVVIAEDDRDIRELVELILDEDGHTTVAASDGLGALERLPHGAARRGAARREHARRADRARGVPSDPRRRDAATRSG